MTEFEICRSFLEARNRRKQIKVLSELTLLSPDEVRAALERNGVDPDAPAPKTGRMEYTATAGGAILPADIRKEVYSYDKYRRRHQRRAQRL